MDEKRQSKKFNKKQRAFLAAYEETGNISRAALDSNVHRTRHYEWLNDPDYADAFRLAEEVAADKLEEEARRRAVQGVDEPVFYKGESVGSIKKFSDTLLIFLLNGARPEKYKQRNHTEVTGKGGGPIQVASRVSDMSDEELQKLLGEGDVQDAETDGSNNE